MPEHQGTCTFPTLNRITHASFTLSHGVSPSSAIITVDDQATRPTSGGTLAFAFGNTRITFPECRINDAQGTLSKGRKIQFHIMDRRWKWQPENGGGAVWGHYNEREPNKKTTKAKYKKTPQQLASILLDAMGESGYDVSRMPNNTLPEVNWVAENPSLALAKLCDSLNCRVVLHLDNHVRIHRKGIGARLPELNAITYGYGINPPERPDTITIVGEKSLFQSRLKLQPICQDTDGQYKHPDQLRWKPSRGWEHEEPQYLESITDKQQRKLAIRDMFHLFEITGEQADGTANVPGYGGPAISERTHLLPLESHQIQFDTQPDGTLKVRPAQVYGEFYDNVQDGNDSQRLPSFSDTKKGTKYPGTFAIDAKSGHVRFTHPVYKHNDSTLWYFPDLAIETAYAVTHHAYNQKVHHVRSRDLPGRRLGTGAKIVTIDGLQRTFVAKYNNDGDRVTAIDDSRDGFDREANYYIDQHAARYENVETNNLTYTGILPIDLDGLRQQVTWKVGGAAAATTQASTNTEHNKNIPPYERRRQFEKQHERRFPPGFLNMLTEGER